MMFLSKGVFLTFDLGFLHVSIIKHWDDGRFCCIAAIVLWGQKPRNRRKKKQTSHQQVRID